MRCPERPCAKPINHSAGKRGQGLQAFEKQYNSFQHEQRSNTMGILDLFSLKGKNALVTGSGQGLGAGMAIAFAQAGANVTLHNYDQVLDSTIDEVKKGREVHLPFRRRVRQGRVQDAGG
jgi:hypothetical protein